MDNNSKDNLLLCDQAFERLVAGKPQRLLITDYKIYRITAAVVSKEAGFDAGYLKKSRVNHRPILLEISQFKAHQQTRTGSEQKQMLDLSDQLRDEKNLVNDFETLYEEALARELVLVAKLAELESQIRKLESNNLRRIKSI